MKPSTVKTGIILVIALIAAAAASSMFSCAPTREPVTFVVNNGFDPASLDPAHMHSEADMNVGQALFEGPLGRDPRTGAPIPALAESWSFSPERTTVTFRFRKASFSDGKPITAGAVAASWLRTLAPGTAATYAYMMSMAIRGAEEYNAGTAGRDAVALKVVDDRTLEVGMPMALPFIEELFAHPVFWVVPVHAIDAESAWLTPKGFVGSGAFVLEESVRGERITVRKNPRYWDAGNVGLDRIEFLQVQSVSTAFAMYEVGEVDWLSRLPPDVAEEVVLMDDCVTMVSPGTEALVPNHRRPVLADARVRKALSLCIDRKAVESAVFSGSYLATDRFVSAMPGYDQPPAAPPDPEAARRLLAEAGFPGGRGIPPLDYVIPAADRHKRLAEYLQGVWKKELGIEVRLWPMEWQVYLDARRSGDFDLAEMGWGADYLDPSNFLEIFTTEMDANRGGWSNSRFDELIATAMDMPAGDERTAAYREAERILLDEEQAIIPVYNFVARDLIDLDKWDGWYPNPYSIHEWKYVRMK